jgi:hypothetical protein
VSAVPFLIPRRKFTLNGASSVVELFISRAVKS